MFQNLKTRLNFALCNKVFIAFFSLFMMCSCNLGKERKAAPYSSDATIDDGNGDDDDNDDANYGKYERSRACAEAIYYQRINPPVNKYVTDFGDECALELPEWDTIGEYSSDEDYPPAYSLSCFNTPKILKVGGSKGYISFTVNAHQTNAMGVWKCFPLGTLWNDQLILSPRFFDFPGNIGRQCPFHKEHFQIPITDDCYKTYVICDQIKEEAYEKWEKEYNDCLNTLLGPGSYEFSVETGIFTLRGEFWIVEDDCPVEEDFGEHCLADFSVKGRYDDYGEASYEYDKGAGVCVEYGGEECVDDITDLKELKDFWCPGGYYDEGLCITECPDIADCGGRECGFDPVCGTWCGYCNEPMTRCNKEGFCEPYCPIRVTPKKGWKLYGSASEEYFPSDKEYEWSETDELCGYSVFFNVKQIEPDCGLPECYGIKCPKSSDCNAETTEIREPLSFDLKFTNQSWGGQRFICWKVVTNSDQDEASPNVCCTTYEESDSYLGDRYEYPDNLCPNDYDEGVTVERWYPPGD